MNASTLWLATAVLAQAAGAGPVDSPAGDSIEVQSVWDMLLKGGWMMIPIGLCSLAALTVIVERALSLRRNQVIPPGFLEKVGSAFDGSGEQRRQAMEVCREDGSPIANVFLAGLKRIRSPEPVREKAIEEAGEREVFKLRKYLRVLAVVATIAPVLGLLGTVFGMIKAFQTVAIAAEALGKTELLAKGIYEALITTAAGLVLAIPALIAYHWMLSRIDHLVQEMDRTTVEFFEERAPLVTDALKERHPAARTDDGNGETEDAAAIATARV